MHDMIYMVTYVQHQRKTCFLGLMYGEWPKKDASASVRGAKCEEYAR